MSKGAPNVGGGAKFRGGSSTAMIVGLLMLLIVAAVISFIVWVNTQPDVIRAKADLANANANLMQARQPIMDKLPEAFGASVWVILATAGGFIALFFFGSMAVYTLMHKADQVLSHGVTVQRNENGQVSSWKLEQTHPAPMLPRGGKGPDVRVDKPQNFLPRDERQHGNSSGYTQQRLPLGEAGRPKGRNDQTQSGRGKGAIQEPVYTALGVPGDKLEPSELDPLDVM